MVRLTAPASDEWHRNRYEAGNGHPERIPECGRPNGLDMSGTTALPAWDW